MATLVGILSVVVDVAVSFMTDGNWKTAGTGLAQLYWNRTNLAKRMPRVSARGPRERSFRFVWSAAGDALG
jgi:hypothetical protein